MTSQPTTPAPELRLHPLTDCGQPDCTPVEHWQRLALEARAALASEVEPGLREAALEVCRATEAYRDAVNGLGHPGEAHDRAIHFGPGPGGIEIFDEVEDCANCGGAQYGTEYDVQRAMVRLKIAVGHPLQEWEEHNHGEIAAEARAAAVPAATPELDALRIAAVADLRKDLWTNLPPGEGALLHYIDAAIERLANDSREDRPA